MTLLPIVSVPVDDKLSTLSIPPWSRFVYTIPPAFEAVVPTPLTNRSRTFELNESTNLAKVIFTGSIMNLK